MDGTPHRSSPGWLMAADDVLTLRMDVARQAQRQWAAVDLRQRARALGRAADWMLEHQDELLATITRENGKREVEALGHEIGASIANVRWLCEAGRRALEPESVSMPLMPHRRAELWREPWGVELVIAPWNFPLSIPLGQVVAGLLAGNAVILKPSEITPRIGAAVEDVLSACGLPPGLFSVVQGDGRVGAELIAARPDKIFFTGSLATGRKVMEAASRFPIPVSMELGGVDALIVLPDADLELASSAVVWGGLFNGGQVCASVERVLVHESIREVFVQRVVDKAAALEPATDLGRITASRQKHVYEHHLADARARGLELRCGGEYLAPDMLQPTVIEGAGIEDAAVYREETFGPVIAVRTFRSEDEAVRMHDELWGGLTASVFGRDEARAAALGRRLRAGLVAINDVAATLHAVPELPWGGVGSAGFGRSHGVDGLLEHTWPKVVDRPRAAGLDFKRPWWFPYDQDQRALIAEYTRFLGARGLGARARAASQMGRHALRMFLRHPRL
jgi:succinate-semialdehyde dehydrogenase/glutarate-semialdehyde dehydrogenase